MMIPCHLKGDLAKLFISEVLEYRLYDLSADQDKRQRPGYFTGRQKPSSAYRKVQDHTVMNKQRHKANVNRKTH